MFLIIESRCYQQLFRLLDLVCYICLYREAITFFILSYLVLRLWQQDFHIEYFIHYAMGGKKSTKHLRNTIVIGAGEAGNMIIKRVKKQSIFESESGVCN